MILLRSWLLYTLRRVEISIRAFPEAQVVRGFILVLCSPRPVRVRQPKQTEGEVLEGLGRPLPPAPKARPLLKKLAAPHLKLVVSNSTPEPSNRSLSTKRAPPDPDGERISQAIGAKSLLLEIVRRAAFDWVLYRGSRRLDQKALAEDAYTWLFVEGPGHPNWKIRKEEGKELTSFLSICEQLDLDPEKLRGYVRNLTPNRVMSSGRPPENSRPGDATIYVEVHANVPHSEGAYDFDSLMLGFELD
jgi:hypothetical protein